MEEQLALFMRTFFDIVSVLFVRHLWIRDHAFDRQSLHAFLDTTMRVRLPKADGARNAAKRELLGKELHLFFRHQIQALGLVCDQHQGVRCKVVTESVRSD